MNIWLYLHIHVIGVQAHYCQHYGPTMRLPYWCTQKDCICWSSIFFKSVLDFFRFSSQFQFLSPGSSPFFWSYSFPATLQCRYDTEFIWFHTFLATHHVCNCNSNAITAWTDKSQFPSHLDSFSILNVLTSTTNVGSSLFEQTFFIPTPPPCVTSYRTPTLVRRCVHNFLLLFFLLSLALVLFQDKKIEFLIWIKWALQ